MDNESWGGGPLKEKRENIRLGLPLMNALAARWQLDEGYGRYFQPSLHLLRDDGRAVSFHKSDNAWVFAFTWVFWTAALTRWRNSEIRCTPSYLLSYHSPFYGVPLQTTQVAKFCPTHSSYIVVSNIHCHFNTNPHLSPSLSSPSSPQALSDTFPCPLPME